MSDDAPEDEYDLLPPIGKRQRFRTYSRKQCKAEKLALLKRVMCDMEALHQHWTGEDAKIKNMILDNLDNYVLDRLRQELTEHDDET